jgi:hypothetical protein
MDIFENKHNDTLNLFQSDEAFMLGNLFQDLYQSYKGFSNYIIQPTNQRQQLLLNVQINSFVAHEINLYLDNHPNDLKMIQLYSEYVKKANQAKKEYEKCFGPLNVSDSSTSQPFEWIESPWPWQHQTGGDRNVAI